MMHFAAFRGAQAAAIVLGVSFLSVGPAAAASVLTNSDGVIRNSLCVGTDCADGESFGFATLRLKENNTRIDFVDTSTGGFPTRDWRLEANSSSSGGASYFAIKDMGNDASAGAEGGTALLTVSAGAPANSIFVSSNGRVGFGTSTPALDLHRRSGNTPSLRLEQDGSSGFAPQTWDLAGNETSFFIRDVTGGSRLPFRIRPGAPTSSIDIGANGFVGFGTAAPSESIHVSTSGDASLRLQTTGASQSQWSFLSSATNGHLSIRQVSSATNPSGTVPMVIRNGAPTNSFHIAQNGNVGIGTGGPASQLHTTGTVRFAALPNCPGIQTDANGVLSCSPGASASAKYASLTSLPGTKAATSGSRTSPSPAGSASVGAPGRNATGSPEAAAAETCDAGDLVGRWKLIGTNIEKFAANSVLWCDVQLTQAQGRSKISYSISGNCRNHAPDDSTPEEFSVDGKGSITEMTTCVMGGSFRIKQGSAVVATANILEGWIEGPANRKNRAIALSRMPRGRSSAIQTFVLQR
jgi:hypothetical protein